jgi:DNA-binding transcriptional ArsR family regulator
MGSAGRGKEKGQRGNARRDRDERPSTRRLGARQRRDDDLVRSLDHRLRREIMRLLHASKAPLGTCEIADGLGEGLGRTCHHVQVLRRRGLVALVGTAGDGEAFYVSRIKDQSAVTIFLEQANKTDSVA